MTPDKTQFAPREASLGEILVRVGVITPEQLLEALKVCDPEQRNLGQILVSKGFATEEGITKAVSIRLGIPYFTSFHGIIEPEAVKAIPESMARRCLAIPLFRDDDSLTVGMANPMDLEAVDDISRHTGLRVLPVLTTLSNLFDAIQRCYASEEGGEASGQAEPAAPKAATAQPQARMVQPPVDMPALPGSAAAAKPRPRPSGDEEKSAVELVNAILQEGLSRKASDIHVEPAAKHARVRYRVDGMLQEGRVVDKAIEAPLVARIKILSRLDITETRLPQDGHLMFTYGGRNVDVRVSVLPTSHGEKVVLRLLDSTVFLRLSQLGLSAPDLKAFSAAIRQPNGIILVTGPTGSGKTTTLYAAVSELNSPTRNIVTLEDPIEYHIEGINQVETMPKIGLTFAAGLRSILRQDPNIVLVGEIRDEETAEIAIQAACTGQLVFSTLHTNSAVTAVHRLINMRIEPFLLSAALRGVLAQRLVRRLCERCKVEHKLTQAELEALGGRLQLGGTYCEAAGCEACFGSGYAGRVPIYEWLPATRELRDLVLKRASIDDLAASAKRAGMRTLREDAVAKAGQGLTSLAEVIRVTREEA